MKPMCKLMYSLTLNKEAIFICASGAKMAEWQHSPPTSEAGVWFPARPQEGKPVVACGWSAVYSTEP